MARIGFAGLGHMGSPMVRNLLKAGHQVQVYDVMPEKMQELKEYGAMAVNEISTIARDADFVFTMLQTPEQVKKVCQGEKGIFANLDKNALYIDSSSIDINVTLELHQEAKKKNLHMLDAPVSGGVKGAEAGSLTIMVGGEEKDFQKAQPIFRSLGKLAIHAGPAGSGQAAKICNNLILGISMIGVSEAFTLGKKLGLEPKKLFEICSHSSGQCWSLTSYCPVPGILENVPSNNNYQPGFTAKMMLKDLNLSQAAAQLVAAQTPLGSRATELYQDFINQGQGDLDFSGIIKMFSES